MTTTAMTVASMHNTILTTGIFIRTGPMIMTTIIARVMKAAVITRAVFGFSFSGHSNFYSV